MDFKKKDRSRILYKYVIGWLINYCVVIVLFVGFIRLWCKRIYDKREGSVYINILWELKVFDVVLCVFVEMFLWLIRFFCVFLYD